MKNPTRSLCLLLGLGESHPPLMKSTNVYSDSTLKDKSVTWRERGRLDNWGNYENEFTGEATLTSRSTYSAGVYVFLFSAFLFGVENLKLHHGKCQRLPRRLWGFTIQQAGPFRPCQKWLASAGKLSRRPSLLTSYTLNWL